jgi:leucyl aminopeptidase
MTMTMTTSPVLIVLAVCIVAGWLDPPVVKARRSSSLSYWTQKQPCNRMEWNDLPAVSISARLFSSMNTSDVSLVPKSSSAKKVKDDANDDHDDHYDLVVLGCTTPPTSNSTSSTVVVYDSSSDVRSNVTKTAVTAAAKGVVNNVTVSGSSQENSESKLLSWLNSKGISNDLVASLLSEIYGSPAAGSTSGVAYMYSSSNSNSNITATTATTATTNDGSSSRADTAISTVGAAKALQRLICLSIGQDQQPATASDARKVGTALAALVASKDSNKGSGSKTAIHSCALFLPDEKCVDEVYVTELVTALYVGLYKDERFKSRNNDKDGNNAGASASNTLQRMRIDFMYDDRTTSTADGGEEVDAPRPRIDLERAVKRAVKRARIVAEGVYLAKDIVNAPHNVLNSLALAETAQRLAQQHGSRLSCQVLSAEECEELGMGAFLGVARGSETPAQFLHLTYTPPRQRQHWWSWGKQPRLKDCKRLGIVGKGLLFDTGGYNIKTQMMELMKFDCGGAAAVLGAARAIAQLEPEDVEIHFVVAACENMINEKAMVPGDILSASNGKTIEVMNTDAEGRLTMADALVYVDQTLQCDEIVELSTLTGAVIVALGPSIAGLWTNNDTLAASLLTASATTGEKIWRMPMEEEYKEDLKSKIADLKNLGGRSGGAIAAALFLQEFVKGDKPFAHVDMAGPVWNAKAGEATGYGAKLVTEWACQSRP